MDRPLCSGAVLARLMVVVDCERERRGYYKMRTILLSRVTVENLVDGEIPETAGQDRMGCVTGRSRRRRLSFAWAFKDLAGQTIYVNEGCLLRARTTPAQTIAFSDSGDDAQGGVTKTRKVRAQCNVVIGD